MLHFGRKITKTLAGLALVLLIALWYLRPSPAHDLEIIHQLSKAKPIFLTKALVLASRQRENTRWVTEDLDDPHLQRYVYVVDNSSAQYTVPQNKGNEAMVYLTYIIDHYDDLPDITVFTHAGRHASHNEDLLDNDLVRMIKHLKYDYVRKNGYFNLRCSWDYGCPTWIDLTTPNESSSESEIVRNVWYEIQNSPIPDALAQPCCAQFAASSGAIQSLPYDLWVHYRDWLLNTELSDYASSRVWEYMWQYSLAGKGVFCPAMSECYCKGYGICFESDGDFEHWWSLKKESKEWFARYLKIKAEGKDDWSLKERIRVRNEMLQVALDKAITRGNPP